jgi:hypothetical protein
MYIQGIYKQKTQAPDENFGSNETKFYIAVNGA